MAINRLNLERDGLVVGDTQLVASGGGVSVGRNLSVIGDTFLSNNLTVTGNLTLNGSLLGTNEFFGDLTFIGTGQRIFGDFNNSFVNNRTVFVTKTRDAATGVYAAPNGVSQAASWQAANNIDLTNASKVLIAATATDMQLVSGINGSGTYLPLTFYTGGTEAMRIDTGGNVSIGLANSDNFSNLTIGHTTVSTSTTTGALIVSGGAGISGALNTQVLTATGNIIGGLGQFAAINSTPIGNATASTGAFTTLTTTGNIIGGLGQFAAINSTPIGNSAAASGAFTTVTTSTAVASTDNSTTVAPTSWIRSYGGFQTQVIYTNAGQTFSNTSATFPAGVTKAKVTVVGSGGAGGGNPAVTGACGGGGGGGGTSISYITFVSGAQYWANVGAGGIPVVNANGGGGNVVTFTLSGTLLITCSGGSGGLVGAASTSSNGGAGATATGGNINLTGAPGSPAFYFSATAGQSTSGPGAPGFSGAGGGQGVTTAAIGSAAGNAGTNGGGGSGSIGGAATATTNLGGKGGGGVIVVEY